MANRLTFRIKVDADLPDNRGQVVVKTKDGKTYEHGEKYILGVPEQPASKEDVERKFRRDVAALLTAERAEKIIDAVDHFERVPNMKSLADLVGQS